MKLLFTAMVLLILFFAAPFSAAAQYHCFSNSFSYLPPETGKGICKKGSSGKYEAYVYVPLGEKKIELVRMPHFQCSAYGQIKMESGSTKFFRVPETGDHVGGYHIGTARITGPGFRCLANCCYDPNGGAFLGQVHATHPGCRNLCCKSESAYLAGDCSLDEETEEESLNAGDSDIGIIQ